MPGHTTTGRSQLDRICELFNGDSPDRIPVFLFASGLSVVRAGYPYAIVYDAPKLSLEAQLRLQAELGFDSPPYYAYATYGTWEGADGAVARTYPSSELAAVPTVPYYPVQAPLDIDALTMPDVRRAGMLPHAMEFSRLQAERGLPISVVLGGAYTIAGNICGLDRLCTWIVRSPDLVHQILRKACDHLAQIVEYWIEVFGPDRLVPVVWESLATQPIIAPRHFREFVLPYQRELHERLLAAGIRHILCHICGEQKRNLSAWAEIPMGEPGIVSIGPEIDLEEASHYFPRDVLMGNLDPEVIQNETPEVVSDLTRACIKKGAKHPGGFMLASGCELPPQTPAANLCAIVQAVHEFGP
jgi:uroporphyrinogen decarboxylase